MSEQYETHEVLEALLEQVTAMRKDVERMASNYDRLKREWEEEDRAEREARQQASERAAEFLLGLGAREYQVRQPQGANCHAPRLLGTDRDGPVIYDEHLGNEQGGQEAREAADDPPTALRAEWELGAEQDGQEHRS